MALDGRKVYIITPGTDAYAATPVYVVDPLVVGVYGGLPVEVITPGADAYAAAPVYITSDANKGVWAYAVSGILA